MAERLRNKTAIVTGGGRGIGKAISLAFASEGASVVVVGRDLSKLEESVEEIRSAKGNATAIQTDIADEHQVKEMIARAIGEYGVIDVLVNNSGIIGPVSPVVDMTLDAWNETLAVNLTGAMLCSREALKVMIPRRSGVIVCIGSEGGRGCAGRAGRSERGAYCSSKMGMIGLAEQWRLKWAVQYSCQCNLAGGGNGRTNQHPAKSESHGNEYFRRGTGQENDGKLFSWSIGTGIGDCFCGSFSCFR